MATPAKPRQGDDVIILPSRSMAEAKESFTEGCQGKTSSVRMVHDPTF